MKTKMTEWFMEYRRWIDHADAVIKTELLQYHDAEIEDAFYRNLAFGTGGLRGVIGAGTNRVNIHTIAKASQGLANYLKKNMAAPSVVIGYDSRHKSAIFARVAASVFAANGVKVHLWGNLTPVPTVSFACRFLHASAGVMITASHNPAKYNGYKVYNAAGCQITTEAAAAVLKEIEALDIFSDVKQLEFEAAVSTGIVQYIPDTVMDEYIASVKAQSVLFGADIDRNAKIVYSPLNGAGYVPVTRALSEMGYHNITIVEEQRLPDGSFPTCPYPNPEVPEAMRLGIEYAKNTGADILLATDPDCDRVGVAVKNADGEYTLLSGNEMGLLLLDYICAQRMKHEKMPDDPVMIKTIVSMDMASRIAADYHVRTIDVLTGFKFIGEQIGLLEEAEKESSFIFGFEESYGYLSGSYVRDKDAVNASLLICEMFCYYRNRGITLLEKLDDIYSKYGYCRNTLYSFQFEGSAGFDKMQHIMKTLRATLGSEKSQQTIAGLRIENILDYSLGIGDLPKSDVIKYQLQGNSTVVVRPSGTEPKLKLYLSISAENAQAANTLEQEIYTAMSAYFV